MGILRRNSEQLASIPDAKPQLSLKAADRVLHLALDGPTPFLKFSSLPRGGADCLPQSRWQLQHLNDLNSGWIAIPKPKDFRDAPAQLS